MVCGVSLKRFANSVISRITFARSTCWYAWIIRPYSIIASETWSSWLNSSAVTADPSAALCPPLALRLPD